MEISEEDTSQFSQAFIFQQTIITFNEPQSVSNILN